MQLKQADLSEISGGISEWETNEPPVELCYCGDPMCAAGVERASRLDSLAPAEPTIVLGAFGYRTMADVFGQIPLTSSQFVCKLWDFVRKHNLLVVKE